MKPDNLLYSKVPSPAGNRKISVTRAVFWLRVFFFLTVAFLPKTTIFLF